MIGLKAALYAVEDAHHIVLDITNGLQRLSEFLDGQRNTPEGERVDKVQHPAEIRVANGRN